MNEKYREKGKSSRDKYDADSLAFRLEVMLKQVKTTYEDKKNGR